VTLALFTDAGVNRLTFPDQIQLQPFYLYALNTEFPEAGFSRRLMLQPGTQKIRMSTGAEVQVLVPHLNVPLRFYWAYNPLVYRSNLQPPIVADRAYFPNAATYQSALATVNAPVPLLERHSTFRFAIGHTF
jgi:outer membrane protein insertion porin family